MKTPIPNWKRKGLVCRYGHPLTIDNLVVWHWKHKGTRRCRICKEDWDKTHGKLAKQKSRRAAGIEPRFDRAPRTHCSRGHPLIEGNLRLSKLLINKRECLTCTRELGRARAERQRRAAGVPPSPYATIEWREKQTPERLREQRRKWEAKRRALRRSAFVEDVDPSVVYNNSGGICGICGQEVPRDAFEVDHVVPLARGGKHSYANTQASHPPCNRRKHARILDAQGDVTQPIV